MNTTEKKNKNIESTAATIGVTSIINENKIIDVPPLPTVTNKKKTKLKLTVRKNSKSSSVNEPLKTKNVKKDTVNSSTTISDRAALRTQILNNSAINLK